jgi:hypothetical protein
MKKFLALSFTSLFLVACNSDDNTTEDTQSANIAQPSLAQIDGVWDYTETSQSAVDQIYVSIDSDNNEYIIYDYFGDSFDSGSDCYFKYNEVINDLGFGRFELSNSSEINNSIAYFQVNISITNNQLVLNDLTYPRSSLTESDFTPLCDEFAYEVGSLTGLTLEKSMKIFNLK